MQHHTIPKYNIMIGHEGLEKLQSNIWNEEPVPSKLEVGNDSYDIGITYRGNHIRKFRKKSYRMEFGEYNDYFEAREVHLNAEYCDPSLIRNKLALDFFQILGILSPKSKHVFIEINGNPMGIYLQLESVDDLFLCKRQLEEGAIYYADDYHANFSLLTP
ncbi:CotH protein [Paenibacillus sp. yr247]|nr:CotH protein [Paenibacillus sp. yr247]